MLARKFLTTISREISWCFSPKYQWLNFEKKLLSQLKNTFSLKYWLSRILLAAGKAKIHATLTTLS
jgi:hypothetical protein